MHLGYSGDGHGSVSRCASFVGRRVYYIGDRITIMGLHFIDGVY